MHADFVTDSGTDYTMALPSQAPRSIRVTNTRPAGRAYRPRALRRRRVAMFVMLFVVAAAVIGSWFILDGITTAGPSEAVASGDTNDSTILNTPQNAATNAKTSAASQVPDTRSQPNAASAAIEPEHREEIIGRPSGSTVQALTMGEPVASNATNNSASRNPPAGTNSTPSISSNSDVSRIIAQSVEIIATDPVAARDALNRALHHARATDPEKLEARRALVRLNDEIFLSDRIVPGDPLAAAYIVKGGDTLGKIVDREKLMVNWRLLLRLNNISDARRIRVGQTIKVVYGPFHAVVDKSDYRLDVYSEQYDKDGNRLFVTSFDIGLGEYGSTPIGSWVVRNNSKLLNPAWTNPRTGEQFGADDPENPIGEAWLGLDGTDDNTREFQGYGIHGTVKPDSIGRDESMGCIRLLPGQIDQVWELLIENESTVQIVL